MDRAYCRVRSISACIYPLDGLVYMFRLSHCCFLGNQSKAIRFRKVTARQAVKRGNPWTPILWNVSSVGSMTKLTPVFVIEPLHCVCMTP